MRSLRKSWMGIVLVALFALSLLFWRQSSYVSNIFNSDNVIAKVGKTPISTTCPPNGIVLDPFMGIGSTAEACKRTGRVAYGTELNSKYHSIAIRREKKF